MCLTKPETNFNEDYGIITNLLILFQQYYHNIWNKTKHVGTLREQDVSILSRIQQNVIPPPNYRFPLEHILSPLNIFRSYTTSRIIDRGRYIITWCSGANLKVMKRYTQRMRKFQINFIIKFSNLVCHMPGVQKKNSLISH